MKRLLCGFLLSSSIGLASARADETYIAPVEDAWRDAQVQYAEGRYKDAFGNFYWAAIRDHAQAQEIVGMMYLLGPETYGPGIRRDPGEAEFWLKAAGQGGREVADYVRCTMRRAPEQRDADWPAAARNCARALQSAR